MGIWGKIRILCTKIYIEKEQMKDLNKEILLKIEEYSAMFKSINKKIWSKLISKDDIHTCILNATYKALKDFNKDRGVKFSSYLYQCYIWELKNLIITESKYYNKHKNLTNKKYSYNFDTEINDILIDNEIDCDLFYDKIYKNMTYTEIGKKYGVSRETARKRFNIFIDKFKGNSV